MPVAAPTLEQEVVLLCARTQLVEPVRVRLSGLLNASLDWGFLLAFAARHHTSALLSHHLSSVAPTKIPPPVLSDLQAYQIHLAARNLRIVGQSIPLLQELEREGAPATVWKGPALAYSVYPSPELRTFTDLDILVRRSDVQAARRVLTNRGYRPRHPPAASEDELFRRPNEVVSMWNEETQMGVDVHWGSPGRYLAPVMDCDRLWIQAEATQVDGSAIRALGPEQMILPLSVHGAKHGPHPWPTLKWITDLEAIVRALPADRWEPILARAQGLGCHRMLLLGLSLAEQLLGAPIPVSIQRALASDPMVSKLARPIRGLILGPGDQELTFAERLRMDVSVRERRRDRLWYLMTKVLAPTERDRGGESLPQFLRVPARLVRLGRRYVLNPSAGKALLLSSGRSGHRPRNQERIGRETEGFTDP